MLMLRYEILGFLSWEVYEPVRGNPAEKNICVYLPTRLDKCRKSISQNGDEIQQKETAGFTKRIKKFYTEGKLW